MTCHIAIFDLHAPLLFLLDTVLSQKGYRVTPLPHMLEDLDAVAALEPDALILGYFIGYMLDELEVVERIRQHPRLANIPIVICTTGPLPVRRDLDGRAVGPIQVIAKPFDIRRVLQALEATLTACDGP